MSTQTAMVMHCPSCRYQHVDGNEWATKPHRTHLCANCGHEWTPHEFPTVGVLVLDCFPFDNPPGTHDWHDGQCGRCGEVRA